MPSVPQRWPQEGFIMPVMTPGGVRYARVWKSNDERVTLLWLSREENLTLLARMQQGMLEDRRSRRLHRRIGRVAKAIFGR